jgi:hypothetical protein
MPVRQPIFAIQPSRTARVRLPDLLRLVVGNQLTNEARAMRGVSASRAHGLSSSGVFLRRTERKLREK